MIETKSLIALLVVLGAPTGSAGAQSAGAYVDASLGAQIVSRTIASTGSFRVYDETATIATSEDLGAGLVIDAGGGYRFARRFAVGAAVSTFTRRLTAAVTGAIPSPIFYDRFATVTASQNGLQYSEVALHLDGAYRVALGGSTDLTLGGGPSLLRVAHGQVSASVAPGTQTASFTSTRQTASAIGVHVGVDLTHMAGTHYGFGAFARYVRATVNLPSISGLKAGGIQAGGGVRLRF